MIRINELLRVAGSPAWQATAQNGSLTLFDLGVLREELCR